MSTELRQKVLLLALAAVLLFFGGARLRQWLVSFGPAEVFGLGPARPDVSEVLEARVASLESTEAQGFVSEFTPGRNPWVYGQKAKPPPPPRPKPPRQQPRPQPTITPLEPVAPQERSGKPVPPPIDVEYIGSFGPRSRKIAVFENGETTINALKGDVINKKFRVHDIGFESVDLTFEGFPDEPPRRLALKGLEQP